jgi:hypothetical protein
MGNKLDYILHTFRRLQENNYDVSILLTGVKGAGKSNTSIFMTLKYLDMFSFVCPHCGAEFYKNIYDMKLDGNGEPVFLRQNDKKIYIQCPIEYKIDLQTKKKVPVRGCGKIHPLSQRKKVKFDGDKFIAYDNQDVLDKMFDMPQYAPIILDEAMNVLAGQNHNKSETKYLKEKINVIRPKRHMIFYNIPEITWLDSKVREGFASFWLRMIDRGEAILFEKDQGECFDKWHLKELNKMMGTVKFFSSADKIRRSVKKHPCFFDTFSIPKVPDSIYDEYEYYRNAKNIQREMEEMEVSEKDTAKIVAWNLLNRWDRIRLSIDKSKSGKCTYKVLTEEIMVNPVTRKSLATEPTIRNWVQGVNKYVKSQGKEIAEFAEESEVKETEFEEDDSGPKLEIIGEDNKPKNVVDVSAEVIEL